MTKNNKNKSMICMFHVIVLLVISLIIATSIIHLSILPFAEHTASLKFGLISALVVLCISVFIRAIDVFIDGLKNNHIYWE